MRAIFFRYLLLISAIAFFYSSNARDLPKPPPWLEDVSVIPTWWGGVSADYNDHEPVSRKWAKIDGDEKEIRTLTGKGESSTEQRRKLIKYITLFADSDGISSTERAELKAKTGSLYEQLGDYERSAKTYFEILTNNSKSPLCLQALALQCERLNQKGFAIEIYNYLQQECKEENELAIYSNIARTGIRCLKNDPPDCNLRKPNWWGEYQVPPNWWTNVADTFPKVTCFRDGFEFIASSVVKERDPQKLVKAWAVLSEFSPMTHNEKAMAFMSLAQEYSAAGDRQRAIETAWRIPDSFSGNIDMSISAMKLIIAEFEALNEREHADEIEKMLPCFSEMATNK